MAYYQHNLIKQKNLPLTRPLRDMGTEIADDAGRCRVNRAVDRIDNLLRPIVDTGYDGGEPGGTRHVGHERRSTIRPRQRDRPSRTLQRARSRRRHGHRSATPSRPSAKRGEEVRTNRLAPKPAARELAAGTTVDRLRRIRRCRGRGAGSPDGGACDDSADIDIHSSQGTAQSQRSPSA